MAKIIVAIVSHDRPDCARGALEIFHAPLMQKALRSKVIHVHSLDWQEDYIGKHVFVPGRKGESGHVDRLDTAVLECSKTEADYALIISSRLWPLYPNFLAKTIIHTMKQGKLLAGASIKPVASNSVPLGGLWPDFLVVDLNWQRAQGVFPLPWNEYRQGVKNKSDEWHVPRLSECLSGAYFQRVTETIEEDLWRVVAQKQLHRITDLEPLFERSQIREVWNEHSLVMDSNANTRAQMVIKNRAQTWGPTLFRLSKYQDRTWYNQDHEHPSTKSQGNPSTG